MLNTSHRPLRITFHSYSETDVLLATNNPYIAKATIHAWLMDLKETAGCLEGLDPFLFFYRPN